MPVAGGLYYTFSDDRVKDCGVLPVVLVHGAGSSHLAWPVQLRRLRGGAALAVDLPGHGRSESIARQSIEGYSDSLAAFLEATVTGRAVLVGHSMGGAVALQLALKQPDLVAGVALISSGAYLGGRTEIVERLLNPTTSYSAVDLFEKTAFGPSASAALVASVMAVLRAARPSMVKNDWLACADYDLRPQVKRLKVPLFVAVGLQDSLTPLSYAHFLKSSLKDVTLHTIPEAGHMALLEKTDALMKGLRPFLVRTAGIVEGSAQSAAYSR